MVIEDASGVGQARRCAVDLAEELLLDKSEIARVALVVTEAATNILLHAGRGEILLRSYVRNAPASLEIMALDQGPGIANVAQAMRDGFSTGGSAGLGLGSISRLSSSFEISSVPGKGTAVLARVGRVAPRHPSELGLEWGVVCLPMRHGAVGGDAWDVHAADGRSTILVVDGLGHGSPAAEAAEHALAEFKRCSGLPPEAVLKALHVALHETRGAVAAVAEIDWRQREIRYAGTGNIVGTLISTQDKARHLVSHNGTLGHQVPRFQEFTQSWPAKGLLVMHSDGLSTQWGLDGYPGLLRKDPSLIAGVLYRDFADRRDDVVVLVGRERQTEASAGGPP